MTVKLISHDRWAGAGAGFNRAAADVVYKAMAGMDEDSALVYGRILVADSVRYDLIAHHAELTRAAADVVQKRATTLRRRYIRTAVDKARSGEDATHEINCLVQIGKALDFTEAQRRQYAAAEMRGTGGRFIQDHAHIHTEEGKAHLDQKDALKVKGIPTSKLEGQDLSHYQQAYSQIRDMLAPFHSQELGALLHLHITNKTTGAQRTEQVGVGEKADLPEIQTKLERGDRITSASVSVSPKPGVAGASFDAMTAIAGPRAGGAVADAFGAPDKPGMLSTDRLASYNKDRLTSNPQFDPNEDFSGATRTFGRVERGSRLLQDSLGPAAPLQLQYALAVANHVGQFGPEAQKVFGPAADRAAYRYRGTERAPDPRLMRAFSLLRPRVDGSTLTREQRSALATMVRNKAIKGEESGKPGEGWDPKPVLGYFKGRLPDPDLNELQRRSGVIPPSEGIIIDSRGDVAHQSVGYADDWYLPFNLRHLSALKGGEYIRTRSFGGPTTEDIYTGLVAGARSLTVVSHNGVWTVDFDRNLRGGRRFNDKAARMVGRYGQLLDAVRSEQISRGGLSPSRISELRTEAGKYEPDQDSPAYKDRLKELMAGARQNPVLSQQERGEAAVEWLRGAAGGRTTADGRVMNPAELTNQIIDTRARADYAAHRAGAAAAGMPPMYSQEDFRRQAADRFDRNGSPEEQVRAIAGAMDEEAGNSDKTRGLDRALEQAGRASAERARSLKLDGAGYTAALTALHEQFPYYLDKPTYHPWRDSQGIAGSTTLESTADSGYVAPRFNRPADAEAGYFNRDVTGYGKVKAQSTRFQNYRVGGGKLTPVGERNAQKDTAASTGTSTGAPNAVDDKELQRAADLALLDDLWEKTTFDGGKVGGVAVGGQNIREEINANGFASPALKQFYGAANKSELTSMPPEDLTKLLTGLMAHLSGPDKVLAAKAPVLADFRNGGKIAAPTAAPTSLGQILAEVGKDHDYAGAAYDPRRPLGPEQIATAYTEHPDISRLVADGQLPASPGDPALNLDKPLPLTNRLNAAYQSHVQDARMGRRGNPSEIRRAEADAHALSRAAQLHRRYVDAQKNQPAPPAAVEAPRGDTNQVYFQIPAADLANMSDEDAAKIQTRFGIGGPPGPDIIDGN